MAYVVLQIPGLNQSLDHSLFLIYIYDLLNAIFLCRVFHFAYDTCSGSSQKTIKKESTLI